MRVLLDDAVSVAGDPDVVLVVDIEAVDTHRHSALRQMARRASVAADWVDGGDPPRRKSGRQVGRPGVHHVPIAIEFDDRGRWMCDDRLRRNEVRTGRSRGRCALWTAVDGEDVILRVDAVSGDLARHPRLRRPRPSGAVAVSRSGWIGLDIAGERLRPERIDLEAGSFVGVLCYRLLHRAPEADPDDRCGYDAAQKNEPPLRSEEHTSELQSLRHLVCRLLLEKKNTYNI